MNTKLARIELFTKEAIAFHGLDYSFRWMKNTGRQVGRAGVCNWRKKEIALNPKYVELNNWDEVKNTILHEIAHALRPKHGHNKFWKKTAIEIGCNGSRTYSKDVIRR